VLLVIHKMPLPSSQDVVERSIQRLCRRIPAQQSVMMSIRGLAKSALTQRHEAHLSESL
jgi:hypothetical protein